jgi:hypothetical protein
MEVEKLFPSLSLSLRELNRRRVRLQESHLRIKMGRVISTILHKQ